MSTPNEMARSTPLAAWRRERDAWEAERAARFAEYERQERLDEIARQGGNVTRSKEYRKVKAALAI